MSTHPSPPLAVFDIDGVLADVRHRLRHVRVRPKNWDAFFAEAEHDEAHPEGLALVRELAADHELVFLTGRPEHTRPQTARWLAAHDLGGHPLLMRPPGDRRPAAQVKVQLLRRLAVDRTVALVVDDDALVVAALRDAGYPVRHAEWERRAEGEQLALLEIQESEGRT
jgi:phosphoglycolate phosphatase-like HAD superfamily hydrolase